ncbi:hypothetical protein C3Y90_23780 [Rhizobium sp. UPM1134]|nr:hypothetical protein [Rhizobium ruizarguesonis]
MARAYEGADMARWEVVVNVVSAVSAVAAAAIAGWQAYEASTSSKDAFQAALTTQRLTACVRMNKSLETATEFMSWADLMNKPYSKNDHFGSLVVAIHNLGESTKIFRQMMPGEEAEKILKDTFELRVKLKDMIADGGDYMTQEEIINKVNALATFREKTCDKLFAP